jgi:hypothetical protein
LRVHRHIFGSFVATCESFVVINLLFKDNFYKRIVCITRSTVCVLRTVRNDRRGKRLYVCVISITKTFATKSSVSLMQCFQPMFSAEQIQWTTLARFRRDTSPCQPDFNARRFTSTPASVGSRHKEMCIFRSHFLFSLYVLGTLPNLLIALPLAATRPSYPCAAG